MPTTRPSNKTARPGLLDRPAKERRKGEDGKTVKQMKEEAKERKMKEEQDKIRRIFEIEQEGAQLYNDAATTTPAGGSRKKVGKVTKKSGAKTFTTIPATKPATSTANQQGPALDIAGQPDIPADATKEKKPGRKIWQAIQTMRDDAEGQDQGNTVVRANLKRTREPSHPLVSY